MLSLFLLCLTVTKYWVLRQIVLVEKFCYQPYLTKNDNFNIGKKCFPGVF